MRVLAFAVIAGFATAAAADLYRWVDPESGSVKFSNYPPPWFGDPARERRSPKVEVIRELNAPSVAPKPEEVPEPKRESKPGAGVVDKTPDGPAGKSPGAAADRPADKSAGAPEPDPLKEKRGDGR